MKIRDIDNLLQKAILFHLLGDIYLEIGDN
jgi:hypothetical protein